MYAGVFKFLEIMKNDVFSQTSPSDATPNPFSNPFTHISTHLKLWFSYPNHSFSLKRSFYMKFRRLILKSDQKMPMHGYKRNTWISGKNIKSRYDRDNKMVENWFFKPLS